MALKIFAYLPRALKAWKFFIFSETNQGCSGIEFEKFGILKRIRIPWNGKFLTEYGSGNSPGTQRFDEPVSSTTMNCWSGVPMVILPKKKAKYFNKKCGERSLRTKVYHCAQIFFVRNDIHPKMQD